MKKNQTQYLLLGLFFLSQLVGILIVSQYIDFEQSKHQEDIVISSEHIPMPETENKWIGIIMIIGAIFVGTFLILLIIKYNAVFIWKAWFFLSVFISLTYAFFAFTQYILFGVWIAIILAAILAYFKLKNQIIHNITELFIYGGLAAIFLSIINIFTAAILLILISIYDIFMVFKSKHMVTLANAQTKQQLFSGIMIGKPSDVIPTKAQKKPSKNIKQTTAAVVGGGDIAFPLLFGSTAMAFFGSITPGIFVAVGATAGLYGLFLLSKQGKFYPAMPPITVGILIFSSIYYLVF